MKIFRMSLSIMCWVLISQQSFAQERKENPVTGEIALVSNNVDRGLTQSNKDPALQGTFWYKFGPNLRAGVAGSNVSFPNSYSHLLIGLIADLSFSFSSNSEMHILYQDQHYFKPESRDGNVLGLELNIYGYRVIYQQLSNWEGHSTSAKYFAFAKIFDVWSGWKWDNQMGYSMIDSDTYTNYLDLRSSLGIQMGNIFYFGGVTATSNQGQFNGSGDPFFLIGARAKL